jgi:hypothetical protein
MIGAGCEVRGSHGIRSPRPAPRTLSSTPAKNLVGPKAPRQLHDDRNTRSRRIAGRRSLYGRAPAARPADGRRQAAAGDFRQGRQEMALRLCRSRRRTRAGATRIRGALGNLGHEGATRSGASFSTKVWNRHRRAANEFRGGPSSRLISESSRWTSSRSRC